MSKVGLAIVGAGRIGKVHIVNACCSNKINLLYVVDQSEDLAKGAIAFINSQEIKPLSISQLDVALNDSRVQAVIVCTPTQTHYKIILQSLNAGMAVFTEKPVGCSLSEVESVFDAANRLGQVLFCGFNRRFDPALRQIRVAMKAKQLGTVCKVRCTARDDAVPPLSYLKSSGGFINDSGCHEIDVLRWILGAEPESVFATGAAHDDATKDAGDVDTLHMVFNFPNNVIATVDLDRKCPFGYDQRIEVMGTEQQIQINNSAATGLSRLTASGTDTCPPPGCIDKWRESYIAELDHFADIVLHGAEPQVVADDCIRNFRLVQAANLSMSTGQPVRLDSHNTPITKHPITNHADSQTTNKRAKVAAANGIVTNGVVSNGIVSNGKSDQ